MPVYKETAMPRSRYILLHKSTPKAMWDWLILLATIYVAVKIPFHVSFVSFPPMAAGGVTVISDLVVEILLIIDIILKFRTTYQTKSGQVVSDARSICFHYATSWFVVDLVAILPLDQLYAFRIPMMGPSNQEVSERTQDHVINLPQGLSMRHLNVPCPYNMQTTSSSPTGSDTDVEFHLAPTSPVSCMEDSSSDRFYAASTE